jgi:hypothetical protein
MSVDRRGRRLAAVGTLFSVFIERLSVPLRACPTLPQVTLFWTCRSHLGRPDARGRCGLGSGAQSGRLCGALLARCSGYALGRRILEIDAACGPLKGRRPANLVENAQRAALRYLRNRISGRPDRREKAAEARTMVALAKQAWSETRGGRYSPPKPW